MCYENNISQALEEFNAKRKKSNEAIIKKSNWQTLLSMIRKFHQQQKHKYCLIG